MTSKLEIGTLDFREAWNLFKTAIDMDTEEYKKARFGVKIRFDINDYLKNRTNVRAKTGKIFIKAKAYNLETFETELELRERVIKEWLMENYGDVEVARPRGII